MPKSNQSRKNDKARKTKTKPHHSTQEYTPPTPPTPIIINEEQEEEEKLNKKEQPAITRPNMNENIARGECHNRQIRTAKRFRTYFQNANGIKRKKNWQTWQESHRWLKHWNFHYSGFAEANIEWSQKNVDECSSKIKQIYKKSNTNNAGSTEINSTEYQPGGVVATVTDKWTGRIEERISDPSGMGRWCGHRLRCKNNKSLYIITAYRVIETVIWKAGPRTAFRQQWTSIKQLGDENPDPRQQMLDDLQAEIKTWTEKGNEVLVYMDANEEITNTNSKLLEFTAKARLTNIHESIQNPPATYARGHKCIDYMFGTKRVKEAVTKCGYIPFFAGAIVSDHRPIFAEFDEEILFGQETAEIETPNARHIKSTNRKIVDKYMENIDNWEAAECLYDLKDLQITTEWTTKEEEKLQQIDKKLTGLLLTAEKVCKFPAKAPWTTAIHKAFQTHKYWQIKTAGKKNNQQVESILKEIEKEVGEEIFMGNKERSANKQRNKATKQLYKARKEAITKRPEELTMRYEQMVLDGKMDKATAIKNIKKQEQRRRVFQTFKRTGNNKTSGGISHAIRIKDDGSMERIQEKKELDEALYERNRVHFNQASGTPFTKSPLIDLLGHSGVTEFGKDILDGKDLPQEVEEKLDDASIWILKDMKRIRPETSSEIPFDEFIQGFKKWKEATTTSPSGLHLGHYKALIAAMEWHEKNKDKEDKQPNKAEEILRAKHMIITLAIRQGIVIERWKVIHNLFLEKIPGFPRLDKLRVIHIYEADWNFTMRFFVAKKLLYQSAIEKTLRPEQGGGRPGVGAIDLAVKAIIINEVVLLLRLTACRMYNDAKACYDRIIENLANLYLMQSGLAIEVAALHSLVFQMARYYIQTQLGLGQKANGHLEPDPLWGRGQGATDAGAVWGFISDGLIRLYNKHGHVATIPCPLSREEILAAIQAFVDDSILFILEENENGQPIEVIMAENLQLWEKLLHATGGKLELSKCKFVVHRWEFDQCGRAKLWKPEDPKSHIIQVKSSETGEMETVEYMTPDQAYKLLGVPMAIDENTKEQEKMLRNKIQMATVKFTQVPLGSEDVQQGYTCVFKPGVAYALPATNIAWSTLETMQKPIKQAVLPKLGYNRNMPLAVVYAPLESGGIGMLHLAVEQGVEHVKLLIRFLRSADRETNKYVHALVESYQIQAGRFGSMLEYTERIPYVKAAWLEVAREFLYLTRSQIIVPTLVTYKPLRKNDTAIMEEAQRYFEDDASKEDINRCRLHLQVTSVAELTHHDGEEFLEQAFHEEKNAEPSLWKKVGKVSTKWPQQPSPDKRSWTIWRKLLRHLIQPGKARRLDKPLGEWSENHSQFRKWRAYIKEEKVYKEIDDEWWEFTRIGGDRKTTTYEKQERKDRPEEAAPIIVEEDNNTRITIKNGWRTQVQKEEEEEPSTFEEYLLQKEEWLKPIYKTSKKITKETADEIMQATKFILASDGGKENEQLTFGWVIANEEEILMDGHGNVPIARRDSSLRAEAYGAVVVSHVFNAIFKFYNAPIPRTSIKFVCDNKSLLTRLPEKEIESSFKTLKPEHEVIQSTREAFNNHQHVEYEHVKSHQDGNDLSWEATVNTRCDELATQARQNYPPKTRILLPGAKATLMVDGLEVPSDIETSLRAAYNTQDIREYMEEKYEWGKTVADKIDWEAHGAAIRRMTGKQRITITKLIHEWLPLNGHSAVVKEGLATVCPVCEDGIETHEHFLCCRNEIIGGVWRDINDQLEKFWEKHQTHPIIKRLIQFAVSRWRNTAKPKRPQFVPECMHDLFDAQSEIGWNQVINGRWSTLWFHHHDETAKLNKWKTRGIVWISSVIAIIWRGTIKVWKKRCDKKHGTDKQSKQEATVRQYSGKIQAIMNSLELIDVADRDYFNKTHKEIMTMKTRDIQEYHYKYDKFYKCARQRVKEREATNQNPITRYISVTRNEPKPKRPVKIIIRKHYSQTRLPGTSVPQEKLPQKKTRRRRRPITVTKKIFEFFTSRIPNQANPKTHPHTFKPP